MQPLNAKYLFAICTTLSHIFFYIYTLAKVETAYMCLVLPKKAATTDATLRPMAKDVYPFNLMISYALYK